MDVQLANRHRLEEFIEADTGALRRTLRYYLSRSGLATASELDEAANDLLNEVVAEAYACLDRLAADAQPRAWLLGIAANLIKRQQVAKAKRERREPLIRDLYTGQQEQMSDEELFDLLPNMGYSTTSDLEADENLEVLLRGLTKTDADCLRYAVMRDMDGNALASILGVSVNAARVRMHRALNRLREIHTRRK
jgi:RNA polymerase sigma-70 factor (ECF subfamily)